MTEKLLMGHKAPTQKNFSFEKYTVNLFKTATLKKTENWFSRPITINAFQKYCRMLQGEHSAILSTFIKLPFVIKISVLSNFEWPFYAGFLYSDCRLKQ